MRFDDITERAGVATKRWATGAHDGGHQQRRVSRHLCLGVRARHGPSRRSGRTCCSSTTGIAHSRKLRRNTASPTPASPRMPRSWITTGRMPRPLSAQQFAAGFLARRFESSRRACAARRPAATTSSIAITVMAEPVHQRFRRRRESSRDAGYGLGVVVADLNGDGWPDIYVSNDVTPNDVLYVNNGNGTFTNKAAQWLKHASFAGHGRRHRRFQQRWPARHPAGRHDAARPRAPQAHERIHDIQQSSGFAQPRISRRLLRATRCN